MGDNNFGSIAVLSMVCTLNSGPNFDLTERILEMSTVGAGEVVVLVELAGWPPEQPPSTMAPTSATSIAGNRIRANVPNGPALAPQRRHRLCQERRREVGRQR